MGTLYCNHDDEEVLYGPETVPCPFCGYGSEEPGDAGPLDAARFEDSHDALLHAMTLGEDATGPDRDTPDRLNAYW